MSGASEAASNELMLPTKSEDGIHVPEIVNRGQCKEHFDTYIHEVFAVFNPGES